MHLHSPGMSAYRFRPFRCFWRCWRGIRLRMHFQFFREASGEGILGEAAAQWVSPHVRNSAASADLAPNISSEGGNAHSSRFWVEIE